MTLSVDAVTRISRSVVLEHGAGLNVVSVTATEGGSDRVELLITIEGCHEGPCRFLINVTRANDADFERELRTALQRGLEEHSR